jgi:hypothetical protein
MLLALEKENGSANMYQGVLRDVAVTNNARDNPSFIEHS